MHRLVPPALLLAFIALAAVPLTAQQALPDIDIKAIWHELTPEERSSYEALMAEQNARVQAAAKRDDIFLSGPVAGDTCTGPDGATVALPYMDSGDTTALANDYDLDDAGANGDCGSGQFTFAGTGAANEITYSIETDIDCTLQIDAAPTAAWDLALYVVESSCNALPGFVNNECIALDDNGGASTAETVTISAVAGTRYFVIIDGFDTAVGPYDLDITEVGATGCNLVPVELMSYSVD